MKRRHFASLHVFKFAFAIATLVFIQPAEISAQVRSDLEIKQQFDQKVERVRKSILQILRPQDADSLLNVVKEMEIEFSDDVPFLNQVLEPKSVSSVFGELTNLIAIQRSQLQTIDSQRDEIVVLNQKISTVSNQLQRSSFLADSLRTVISRTNASREVMSTLVRDYRAQLEERDRLILLFVDSLTATYDDPRLRELLGSEQQVRVNVLNTADDALKMVQNIINENIDIISGSTEFDTQFYLQMDNLHQRVEEMWSKLGLTISTVYEGRQQAEKVTQSVNDRLLTWKQRLRGGLWSSMHHRFTDSGIPLQPFTNETEFVTNVNAYLDSTIVRLQENVTEEDYRSYQLFKQFWTAEVKDSWVPLMIESKLITMDEVSMVDQKIEDWGSLARPRSDNLHIYFGISLAIILGLSIMLIQARRNIAKVRSELAQSSSPPKT